MTATPADRDLLERVVDQLRGRTAADTVRRSTVGAQLVGVEIDGPTGHHMGVAHRPPGQLATAVPTEPLAAARWAFEPPNGEPIESALGMAAMNAMSAPHVPWSRGDPMAALESDVERIATVGLFSPAFRRFDAVDVRVIEREPIEAIDGPDDVAVSVHPPAAYEAAIQGVDVVFVTGSSLVYGGTTRYLRAAADIPSVVLIGATASFLPRPALEAGATVMAGARVTAPERVRTGIEAGLCGADLHDRGLEKVYVAAEASPDGLTLEDAALDGQARRD